MGEFDFSRRIPELDGVRGLAIALVLAFHFTELLNQFHAPALLLVVLTPLTIAWCGVDLFFVLSGFLIGGILLDARSSPNYFRTFYIRRVCRIMPAYFAFLAIAAISTEIFHLGWGTLWQTSLVFMQNLWIADHNSFAKTLIGHTWSVAVEEQFYLLLPAVIYLARPRALPRILAGGVAVAFVLRPLFLLSGLTIATYVLLPCRMDALLIGALLAWALRQPGSAEFLRAHRVKLWTAIEILTILSALYFLAPAREGMLVSLLIYDSLALLFAGLIAASFVDQQISRVLRTRWLRGLGTIAYGLYLVHVLVFDYAIWSLPKHPVIAAVIGIFVSILVAKISWEWFERPIVRLGHRVSYTAAPSKVDPNLAPAAAR